MLRVAVPICPSSVFFLNFTTISKKYFDNNEIALLDSQLKPDNQVQIFVKKEIFQTRIEKSKREDKFEKFIQPKSIEVFDVNHLKLNTKSISRYNKDELNIFRQPLVFISFSIALALFGFGVYRILNAQRPMKQTSVQV